MPSLRDLEAKDASILLSRIKGAFPNLSWKTFEYINHSWDHEIIILDNKAVFRFPASSEYLPLLHNEVRLLNHLSDTVPVSIPHYIFVPTDYSFAGYKIIPGVELTESVFRELDTGAKDTVASQLASFLSHLHNQPLSDLRQFNVTTADLKKESIMLRAQADKYLKTKLTTQEYKDALDALDELDRVIATQLPAVLTHNDLSPKHILWDDSSQQIGIIDFSDRAIADPAFDFTELFLYGRDFAQKVYDLYEGPKDSQFLGRAVIYLKRMGIYMLVDSFLTDRITYKVAKVLFDTAMKF